jgi:hypothetical protein
MIARAGSGWQTVLADLSLILFMVTAATVSEAPPEGAPPAFSEPVAQWRGEAGAPDLAAWLAAQPKDLRQQLTIVAAPAAAQAALDLASSSGRSARVLLDPRFAGPPLATLAYDSEGPVQ